MALVAQSGPPMRLWNPVQATGGPIQYGFVGLTTSLDSQPQPR